MYYDYQLSNERQNFGDEALAVKMTVLLLAISLVSNGNKNSWAQVAFTFVLFTVTSKAEKLPLKTETVARDNNTIWMLKPDYHTSVAPYSTDNRIEFHQKLKEAQKANMWKDKCFQLR